jgi:hypothetical protein
MKARILVIVALVALMPLVLDFSISKVNVLSGNVTSVIDYSNYQFVSVDTNGDGNPELIAETFNYKFRHLKKLSEGEVVDVICHDGLLLHDKTIYRR